jgi:HlyD family secretion protein
MNKGCLIGGGAILFALTIALGIYFFNQSRKDPLVYEVESPTLRDIVKKTVATGAVRPRKEVNIKPQVSGVIEALYVEPGQMIKQGQQIARVKLVPSEVNINNATSSVELARLRFENAQRELARQQNLNDQQLDVESAKVAYDNAEQEVQRNKGLFEDGVISEQTYNSIVLDRDLRKAEYENAKIAATNNLRQFEIDVDIRRQELDAAVNNLELLREGFSSRSKQVANVVTSTVDGMVLEVPVEEGTSVIERNNFNEGTTIASVADMQQLVFEGTVDESDVGKLREGMPLELTIGAIEEATFGAILEYIAPKGTEEEGTVKFEVKAAIEPQQDVFLRAGYSANADIILDRRENVLAIKERDLLFEQDSIYVEVQIGDQRFEKHPVQVGVSDGIWIELLGGVDTTTQIKVQQIVK